MGITERREREHEEVRQKILDAARELFATEGYEKVTMRRIAEAIEYSPTTIYLHFEDKDDLVLALCHEDFGRLLAAMQQAPCPPTRSSAIRQLGRAYARFALQLPEPLPLHVHDPARQAKQKPEDDAPGPPVLRRPARGGRARPSRRGASAPATRTWWRRRCSGRASTGRSALSSPAPRLLAARPRCADLVDQTIENGLRGFLADPGKA